MTLLKEKYRRILANALFFVGGVGALLTNGIGFTFILYYSIARPTTARPELSWIVVLPWARTYGSVEEVARLYSLHSMGGVLAILCFSGWALWNWRAIRAELKSDGSTEVPIEIFHSDC